ncbi:MAG TPA: hypothetical protein VHP36_05395 [Chitinispirillaceae bacterium]|nr:hypothetical protein [Chitinispirillaceae bacterium]
MRYFVFIPFLFSSVFAQSVIPIPTSFISFLNATIQEDSINSFENGLRDIKYSRPSDTKISDLTPDRIQNIGDFDGDGSEELFLSWEINYSRSYRDPGSGSGNISLLFNMISVYSFKKNTYLIQETGNTSNVITGDFDGDSAFEFIIGKKIYKSSSAMSKKKVR